ncbi:MAG: efflux RND transporter periplasmic adaptor subunit [Nitrospirota bacterium]|jgi:RND family efflux transporter MFP subunit
MKTRPLGLTLIVFALVVSGCERGPEKSAIERPEITGAGVGVVNTTTVKEYYEASGTVRASSSSSVSSRVMGTVTSGEVREGDRVSRGQLLLTIDDRDLRQKVRAAEEAHTEAIKALESARSRKELADKTYERFKRLHEERALTGQEFDEVETRRKVAAREVERMEAVTERARAALEEARVFLGFTKVVSPTDGVVAEKMIDEGSMASPGKPLMIVEDTSSYTIDVALDERFINDISRGMKAEVRIPSLDGEIEGTVAEAVPSVNPASRTFRVKVSITHPLLRNGMYGKVRFAVGAEEALLISKEAVVRKGQLTGVYTVDEEGNVTYRLVRTGKSYPEGIEILSGIDPGERIILEGAERASDGGVLRRAAQ